MLSEVLHTSAAKAVLFPVVAFFSVPVFVGLIVLAVVDFVTGIYKAMLLKRVASNRFGIAFERLVGYTVVFATLHVLTLVAPVPFNLFTQLVEGFVMTGMLLKEAISILENTKAIQKARGLESPMLDLLIDKLGLDLDRILKDFKAIEPPTQAPAEPTRDAG